MRLTHGDIRFVLMFAAIACFIYLLSLYQTIPLNLSTAKSATGGERNRTKKCGALARPPIAADHAISTESFETSSPVHPFFSCLLRAY